MFAAQFSRQLKLSNAVRKFNFTAAMRESKPSPVDAQKTVQDVQAAISKQEVLGTRMYYVTNFDRWLLVWVKRYPSKAEVPKKVTEECILQARSRARIKTCNIMIIISVIGFIWGVYSGKKDAKAGKGINRMYIDSLDK